MMVMVQKNRPFHRSGKADRKRLLLRRADSERETAYGTGLGKKRDKSALFTKKPITLPRVKAMEKPEE